VNPGASEVNFQAGCPSGKQPGIPTILQGRRLGETRLGFEMRRNQLTPLSALVVGLALVGCASTSTSSYRDPSFAQASYRKVAVMASGVQLGTRQQIEGRLATALRGKHIQATEAMQLFPPTREIGQDDMMALLHERGFDGLLFVERVESGATSHVTNFLTGASEPLEFIAFDARLIDVASGQNAWVGSLRTEANSGVASNADILESFTASTADELEEKQLLGSTH
jgi:hypothetical protein